jgi:hypothetical protein
MKKQLFSLFCFSFIFLACTDENTSINITVKNKAGIIQSNVLVYEFEYPSTHQYGSSPYYANTHKLTNNQGVAQFDLQGYEFNTDSTLTTLYFTVFDESSTSNDAIGTVSATFKKGDSVSEYLIINQ